MCIYTTKPTADAMAFSNARFGRGSGAIVLDNVACTGSEERLIYCPYDSHTADCSHSEDAGVRCPNITRMSETNDCLTFQKLLIVNFCLSIFFSFFRSLPEWRCPASGRPCIIFWTC